MNAYEAAKTSRGVYRKQHPTPLIDFWHKRITAAANLGRRYQYFSVNDEQLKNEELTIYQLLKTFKYEGYQVNFSSTFSRTYEKEWEIKISW